MDSETSPVGGEGARAVAASSLRDEIEILDRRMGSTVGTALGITALFVVSGLFMEQAGTLWFLGALWLFFIGRLGLINRTTRSELCVKKSELAMLTDGPEDPALPNGG